MLLLYLIPKIIYYEKLQVVVCSVFSFDASSSFSDLFSTFSDLFPTISDLLSTFPEPFSTFSLLSSDLGSSVPVAAVVVGVAAVVSPVGEEVVVGSR